MRLANSDFDWRLAGSYDKPVRAGCIVPGLALFSRFLPAVRRANDR